MGTEADQPGVAGWKSDFFGTLNELPPEPVAGIGNILEAMGTLPAFQGARQWLLQNLGLSRQSSLVEGGCGCGTSLPDILSIIGSGGRVVGLDPTKAFLDTARLRAAKLGASGASYQLGDIRSMPVKDGEFDAAFCDKVLIHAGPPLAALSEMARVTRAGGRVGAVEWLPFFSVSSRKTHALEAFNAIFKAAVYDYYVSANLARHFHAAGLKNVRTHTLMAHTDNLDSHPFWRAFMLQQLPMFIHAGLIDQAIAQVFQEDVESLHVKGEFSACFVVQAAVAMK
jgi:ubiquinone/menaquinone biosynthesis C-methylase UbiE